MGKNLASLAERKLIVVTGKGGAGKSYLSVSIAHRLASQGKQVKVVEIGRKRDRAFSRLPEILGLKKLEHEAKTIRLGEAKFKASILDPTESLSEYVNIKLPTAGLAGMLLNNRVTASFLEVVPGLPDLVTLGKLWHELEKSNDGADHIILDAPATGHALALLRAPENFRKITKIGPIYKDANLMTEFLQDENKTAIALVSLPEEMSLQETLESKAQLKGFPKPFVFINKCFPSLPEHKKEGDSIVWKTYSYARARGEREAEAVQKFKDADLIPFFFPDPEAPPLYQKISESL